MADFIDTLTGAGARRAAQAQKDAAISQQRRSLAQVAADQATSDAGAVTGGRRRGRRLLSFLSGDGQGTLG